jgi:acylphosphatase
MLHGVTLRVTGQVQGVFLRSRVRDYAQQRGLGGFVKNEYDGSVTITAVGAKVRLDALIDWLRSSPGRARVQAVTVDWAAHPQPIQDFTIISP